MVSGTTLSDRYRIDERIARGGMGSVYLGWDERLSREVAVKVLKEELADDDRFVERFRREARAAAALSHPNIAGVFDFGEDGGRYYIVMELAEGRDLARVLREEGPLDPSRAAAIALQIAEALGHAHAAGLVHRDVKPANVIVGSNDRVRVTDFGIARAASDSTLTATGSILGTAQYVSPEQAGGDPATPRSDIYSFGIVLYEMLTGALPFTGESAIAVAMRHISDEVPRPSELNPAVPPELDEVTAKATAKDPRARYADATELAAALRGSDPVAAATTIPLAPDSVTTASEQPGDTAVMSAESIRTDSSIWPIPGSQWDPRKVGLTVIAAFAILGLIAASLLIWRLAQDDEAPARDRRQRQGTKSDGNQSNDATLSISEDIVGQNVDAVRSTLEQDGFDVNVEFVESELPENSVVDTDPPPGTSGIETSTPITLYASSGEGDEDDEENGPGHGEGKGKGKDKEKDD